MYVLNTDGGARGNPGPGAAAAILYNTETTATKEKGIYLGICTNNIAEYKALLLGLAMAQEDGVTELTCKMDSELIVNQLKGIYKVKDFKMIDLYGQVQNLLTKFTKVTFIHVPRSQNKEADRIVNEVLDSMK